MIRTASYAGLLSCTVWYDYSLYGTDRTCYDTAYYRSCHTVFYRNYGSIRYGVRYSAMLNKIKQCYQFAEQHLRQVVHCLKGVR